jgi:MYXO-CTERM domain-containing protein
MLAALARAGLLGLDLAKGRAKASVRQFARQAAMGAAALLFLLLAFGFGLAAFAVWLAREIGTVPALGFIGLFFLLIAGIIVAVAAAEQKRDKKPQPIITAVKQEFVAAETGPPPTGSTVGAMGLVGLIAFLFARQLFRR